MMKTEESVKKEATLIPPSNGKPSVVKITFPFQWQNTETMKNLDRIKGLAGRRYYKEASPRYWTIPLNIDAVQSLKGWGFQLDKELHKFLIESKIDVYQIDEMEVPGLKGKLYPFQKVGVAFMEARNGRILLADEMGLGKTIQALAWLHLHPELRPAVVIAPATGKFVWRNMAKEWLTNPEIQLISGREKQAITGEIIVLNYDILADQTEAIRDAQGKATKKRKSIPGSGWIDRLIKQVKPEIVILDECHKVKNSRAARTKAVKRFGRTVPIIMGLSGTPAKNRPIEPYNALRLIDKTVVPDFWDYVERYCGAYHDGYGWNFDGATNTEELHERLKMVMLRRTKAEVMPELPPKTRAIIPVELDNRKEYERAEEDFINWVRETRGAGAAKKASKAEELTRTEALKQIAVKGKLKQAIDWIQDFLDTDEKLVVFATHKFVINALVEKFKDVAIKLDGSTSEKGREEAEHRFQNDDEIRLFVGNIQAAGEVITLHAASNTAFLELAAWSPSDYTQAEDRVHRIGQEADSVTAHYLLAENTIEENIAKLLDKKRKVIDSMLDGKVTEDESLLTELLKMYGGKE